MFQSPCVCRNELYNPRQSLQTTVRQLGLDISIRHTQGVVETNYIINIQHPFSCVLSWVNNLFRTYVYFGIHNLPVRLVFTTYYVCTIYLFISLAILCLYWLNASLVLSRSTCTLSSDFPSCISEVMQQHHLQAYFFTRPLQEWLLYLIKQLIRWRDTHDLRSRDEIQI